MFSLKKKKKKLLFTIVLSPGSAPPYLEVDISLTLFEFMDRIHLLPNK